MKYLYLPGQLIKDGLNKTVHFYLSFPFDINSKILLLRFEFYNLCTKGGGGVDQEYDQDGWILAQSFFHA